MDFNLKRSLVYSSGFCLLAYSIVATAISYFASVGPPTRDELLWSIPLLLFFGAFIRERRLLFKFPPSFFRDNLDFFAVLVGLLALRLFFLDYISIWLDEDFQAAMAWRDHPVAAGVSQHHPPGDMVFTKLGLVVSGYSIWGLRIHAAVFSALAGLSLYALTKQFSNSRLVALLCVFFYSTHHVIFRYGFEARPISYGLFAELLFLAAVYFECQTAKDPSRQRWSASLSAITFLYLCSLGLQPPFIVALTIGFFALFSFFRREFLSVFLKLSLGLLSFLPLQLVLLQKSPPRFTRGYSLLRFFDEFSLHNFAFLNKFFVPIGYFSVVGAFVYLLWFAFNRKKSEFLIPFLLYLVISFPIILVPFFLSHVSWPLNHYYLISILPLLFLLFSALWGSLPAGRFHHPWLTLIIPVVLFAGFIPYYKFINVGRSLEHERQDLKGAYASIKESSQDGDLTLSFCISAGFCPDLAIGKILYRLPPPSNSPESSVEIYAQALRSSAPPQNIFFVQNEEWGKVAPPMKYLFSSHFWAPVYKVPSNGNMALAVINFFEGAVKDGLAEGKMYSEAVGYLVASYDFLGDEKNTLHYLELYRKMAAPDGGCRYLHDLSQQQQQ